MPLLVVFAFTLLLTYWTFRDASARQMPARRWALAAALTSGLSVPAYLAFRPAKVRG